MRSRIREKSLPRQSARLATFASTSGERVMIVGSLLKNLACMPASPRLDHLPSVAGRIAEAGVDAAVAFDRFLRELDAAAAQFVMSGGAIVDDEDQRRHRTLGHDLAYGRSRRFIDRRRLRLEQPELERCLLGMLHRQPPII